MTAGRPECSRPGTVIRCGAASSDAGVNTHLQTSRCPAGQTGEACFELAKSTLKPVDDAAEDHLSVVADNERAVDLLLDTCKTKKHARACGLAGAALSAPWQYLRRDPNEFDRDDADQIRRITAYDSGCRLGDASSCYHLGFIYFEGLTQWRVDGAGRAEHYVFNDVDPEGILLFQKACYAKFERACERLQELRDAGLIGPEGMKARARLRAK